MNLNIVILAAGRGKRMRSRTPKVLHEVLGAPMLQHVVDAVKPLSPRKTIIVIGNGADLVKKKLSDERGLTFVTQKELLGTGDALATAKKEILKGTVLVLNGDCPLITTRTLKMLLAKHRRSKNALSLLSFMDSSLSGYGRILRGPGGRASGIIEDKHATPEQKRSVHELNGGVYVMSTDILAHLNKIKRNSSSGEYYLTDIVDLVSKSGRRIDAYICPKEEIHGVNSRAELFMVSSILRDRIIKKWMQNGVTFADPATAYIQPRVHIGRDTVIYPNTYIEGTTRIGKNCRIFPGTRIQDSIIGNDVTVKDNTVIEKSHVGDRSSVGPFAHLRPHSRTGKDVKVGNFVELKKSMLGEGVKASHLSYIGDAVVGKRVNIGAGTITCNYDGRHKYQTVIGEDVFVGSDTQFIAPVKIGRGAYIAAGSTVTQDVPPGSLAISRTRQQNLPGWAEKKARMNNSKKRKGK